MLLLNMPLVLVQDIIEQIVLSYERDTDLSDFLELRLVNSKRYYKMVYVDGC